MLSVSASISFFILFREYHTLTVIILRKLSLQLMKELISVSTVSQIFSQLFEKVKVFLRLWQFLVLFTKPFILVIFCFEKVSARIFHSVPSTYELFGTFGLNYRSIHFILHKLIRNWRRRKIRHTYQHQLKELRQHI